jgi:hypothetical protein
MSRLTGNDVRGLMEAYNAVYSPKQLTEEQVWEGVENWVNALVEEGYDLSDYTWEEMYDVYMIEYSGGIDPNAPASGGGMSSADIDARTDLTPEQKSKLKARYTRTRTTVNSSSTAQPQSSTRTAQPPNASWKSRVPQPLRNLGRAGVRSLGALGAADAVSQASQGNYGNAALSGLGGAMSSRRLSSAVPRVQNQVLQKVAPKLAPKLARFVPGVQQAYGLTAGSLAAARGDKLGAVLGYGSAIPGPVGYGFVAADIGREVAREFAPKQFQAFKDKIGYTRAKEYRRMEDKVGMRKAYDTQATRDARQVASQAKTYGATKGSALTGLGGPTSVSQNKDGTGFMSTGVGPQRKTVQLAKTQLVRDPKTGQQRVGDLAYKGGKAVYLARPSVSSRDTSLSANVGRALNLGRYSKEAEQQAAKTEYRTALKNTQTYQKKLGITPKPVVGPKIVGPKIVGPKIVGSKPQPPK